MFSAFAVLASICCINAYKLDWICVVHVVSIKL